MEIEDEKDVELEKDAHADTTCLSPLDLVITQRIMTSLRRLVDYVVLSIAQVLQP